ncbi:MAG: flagellar biosynthesis protein FlhB [Acetobacteraceae bacterium]|nr:flagellar biosynthesis protein FlhB [Acetobacteraceae bacterium]
MAEQGAHEDRTEQPTQKRLAKAREEGNVPVSREFTALAGLAAGVGAIALRGAPASRDLAVHLAPFLAHAHDPNLSAEHAVGIASIAAARCAGPILAAVLIAGAAAVLLQTGFLLHGAALRPRASRINPVTGLRRLLSAEGLIEAAKALIKTVVLGAVAWHVVRTDLPALLLAPFSDPNLLVGRIARPLTRLGLAVLAVQVAFAAADLFWTRFRYTRQLRMSRQDIREEQKESEGDPKIKARIKQIRSQRARKRMLSAVPKATVVVTNPTHYAVALAYDRKGSAAPRVVAKGVDSMAARIREAAEANRVPIVANPPLARALYRIELDTEIPSEHYKAVAEIIAYVWRLRGRAHELARQ